MTYNSWYAKKPNQTKPNQTHLIDWFIVCLFLQHINLFSHLMLNQVKKRGETEKSVSLELISRETVCRKNLVSLKVYF